jgi:hypothetical protein
MSQVLPGRPWSFYLLIPYIHFQSRLFKITLHSLVKSSWQNSDTEFPAQQWWGRGMGGGRAHDRRHGWFVFVLKYSKESKLAYKGWRSGSSGRVSALQAWSPKFRPQYCSPTTHHKSQIHTKSPYSRETCPAMFTMAPFIIAKLWNQSRCPTTDEWIKKIRCVYIYIYIYIYIDHC